LAVSTTCKSYLHKDKRKIRMLWWCSLWWSIWGQLMDNFWIHPDGSYFAIDRTFLLQE
jgi:hypothetical protein